MDLEVEIKNYRCFPDERPATLRLRDGLTGFVGINNAGKSTMLRLLYEAAIAVGGASAVGMGWQGAGR